jgi:DNA-binding beta-propeller fold protein YncE
MPQAKIECAWKAKPTWGISEEREPIMSRHKIFWFGGCLLMILPMLVLSAWQGAGSKGLSAQAQGRGEPRSSPGAVRRAAARPQARKPVGMDVAPETNVADPYPTYNGIAVDPENNVVVMSDLNRFSYLMYDRTAHSEGGEVTTPLRHVFGPQTRLGYVAGIQVDPAKKEVYIAENDGWGLRTFSYDDNANVPPRNLQATPHQAWGISLSRPRKEIAMTIEELHAVLVYRQGAEKLDPPLRTIRGISTGLADPHGVYLDSVNQEIFVANHGNWTLYHPNSDHDEMPKEIPISPGHFEHPSIRVFPIEAKGDVKPLRVIQGEKTGLDWPMQIDEDVSRNEIAVANFGSDSISIFRRTDQGNVAPIREIKGEHTGIAGPVGVAIDAKNDEIWVANYGDHTAVVFPRGASGDVAPKRTIRNAPKDSATCGFTNASSATYDSKRKEILVAN